MLLIVTLSEWAGAQHVVFLLAQQLMTKYEVTVACAPGGVLVTKLLEEGVHVVTVNGFRRNPNPWHDVRAILSLFRLMKTKHFDLVHAHSTKAGLLGRLAARLAGVPVVFFTAHGWAFTEGRGFWKRWGLALVERVMARSTDKIICVSEHDRQLALRFRVGDPTKLVTIHNGLDPALWRVTNKKSVRPQLENALVITMVARLAKQKDQLTLLEAIRLLPANCCKVVLVGDGPMRTEIERFIEKHQLGDHVQLLGARTDVEKILAATDIFALSSRWEGLPLTIIEAMLSELPIVTTRVGGVAELIEDGVTGFLVPPQNPKALAVALGKLVNDASLRLKMGHRGKKHVLRHFTLERMMAQTEDLYQKSLSIKMRL